MFKLGFFVDSRQLDLFLIQLQFLSFNWFISVMHVWSDYWYLLYLVLFYSLFLPSLALIDYFIWFHILFFLSVCSLEKIILNGKVWEEENFGAGCILWLESGPGWSKRVASASCFLVLSQPGSDHVTILFSPREEGYRFRLVQNNDLYFIVVSSSFICQKTSRLWNPERKK